MNVRVEEYYSYMDGSGWQKEERHHQYLGVLSGAVLTYNERYETYVLRGMTEYGMYEYWMYSEGDDPTGVRLYRRPDDYRPYRFKYVVTIGDRQYEPPEIRKNWAELSAMLENMRTEELLEETG